MRILPFDAAVFDLDGVITKTAKIHTAAWTETFNHFLKLHADKHGLSFKEFRYKDDYLPYVDGKPRYKGVQSFLDSRGIELPYGDPSDHPNLDTICGLGNLKNKQFNELIQNGNVDVYYSTLNLIKQLKKHGIKIGVASSSKNCQTILDVVGIADLFETRVDGVISAELGLLGKPEPDIFLTAADNLGSAYDRTIVVEDAVSGVQAGRNGNFGLVIGVARVNNNDELLINGADIIVQDLSDISIERIEKWFRSGLEEDSWSIKYHDYIPEYESLRESLLTVGNGYFGTRGALEEQQANGINYPGTYIAGLYNRLESEIAGRTIINEDFVNCPNWLSLTFKINDGSWLDLNEVEILSISRQLDFRTGMLIKEATIKDSAGLITQIVSRRIASMENPHLAGMRYEISPINYSGRLTIKSGIHGDIINSGVKRYRDLNSKHLKPLISGGEGNLSYLEVMTTQSEIRIALAAKMHVDLEGQSFTSKFSHTDSPEVTECSFSIDVEQDICVGIEKLTAIFTSHEWDSKNPLESSKTILTEINRFDDIYLPSVEVWRDLWDKVDIQIEGDRRTQKLLRLNLYHILITASPHNRFIDAGIPARGLHGEAYRGHIFWDELFILPWITLYYPETSKSALIYRYRRIDKAREYAREFGYRGAMYPWQSGSSGQEETQIVHLNPLSGEWGADNSSLQRHVSLAIAYNIWQYYKVTLDVHFLENNGGEMFLEICRFWASTASFNDKSGRFDIHRVMGPDEFHEKYPATKDGGITNNAYTNIMALWLFTKSRDILKVMGTEARQNLIDKIHLSQKELELWGEIQDKLQIPISESGLIEQFQGFFDLKDLDWTHYREKYPDIARLDRILKNEGKSPDEYQVLKQADVLMLFYILNADEIEKLIINTDQSWDKEYLEKNIHYYFNRTSHGSTLSWLTHAYLCSLIGDVSPSWVCYQRALSSDFNDIQGGTTGEGIHLGVMAGSVYNTLRTYGGLSFSGNQIHLTPNLPNHWRKLAFKVFFRENGYAFSITPNKAKLKLLSIKKGKPELYFQGKERAITSDKWTEIPCG